MRLRLYYWPSCHIICSGRNSLLFTKNRDTSQPICLLENQQGLIILVLNKQTSWKSEINRRSSGRIPSSILFTASIAMPHKLCWDSRIKGCRSNIFLISKRVVCMIVRLKQSETYVGRSFLSLQLSRRGKTWRSSRTQMERCVRHEERHVEVGISLIRWLDEQVSNAHFSLCWLYDPRTSAVSKAKALVPARTATGDIWEMFGYAG